MWNPQSDPNTPCWKCRGRGIIQAHAKNLEDCPDVKERTGYDENGLNWAHRAWCECMVKCDQCSV